jgi:hypothetical protein|tara:strand:+ start:598 stop:1329 length:732 start_codon:yes stop_codon:yes gene_type:complete
MAQPTKNPRPIVSGSLSDASAQVVLDGLDSGFTIDDIAPSKGPKLRGERQFSQEGLDELVSLSDKGAPIPGQSLMNSPEEPYSWEQPPEFTNPREALDYVVALMFEPEAMKNIIVALSKGAAVIDIGVAILYSQFTTGKINPDVLIMLVEPVAYVIMAMGEEANIKYNIEGNDLDEFDDEEYDEEEEDLKDEFKNSLSGIKEKTLNKGIDISNINSGVVPESILAKVEEKSPEIKSILSKGEM